MKIIETERTLKVLPQGSTIDTDMLLNWRTKKGDEWLYIENNVVNRIVLGMSALSYKTRPVPNPRNWMDPRLEEFQQRDVAMGSNLGDILNRNKMGLGKTVETIKMLQGMGCTDVVICAPKTVCPQWVKAFNAWWPEVAGTVELYNPYAKICVINYDKLRNEKILLQVRSHRHDAVVFDEIHKMKNRDTQQTKAAKLIPAQWHIGLTGTPILKHPDDLWSILHALDWRYSGTSYWAFVNYFCTVVEGQFGRKIDGITEDKARLDMLHSILNLVSIHNPNVQVAKGKRVTVVPLEMSTKQKVLYKKIKNLVLDELPENCTIANGAVHAMRLQQATSWPGLFDESIPGAKFEWVLDFCQGTDEQILILSSFAKTANALSRFLQSKDVTCTEYTGQQKEQVKLANKEAFIQGKYQVLVGTIDAVGTGVDGLQVARLGVMLEQDWSPMINEQCEDRLNRKGQERPVRWYYLQCNRSFDNHVGKVNLKKADSIRKALEEE